MSRIKQPAVKENSWETEVSLDPSNPPPCKVLPGGIFYTEDEVCLFQYI